MTESALRRSRLGQCVLPTGSLSSSLLVWLERRGEADRSRPVRIGGASGAIGSRKPSSVASPVAHAAGLPLALLRYVLVFAMMRPQWGMRTIVTAPTFSAEIMICLDVSKSMLAEDVAPNRLERAKAEVADLLTYMDGNQVGIIAFAGRASVLSPADSRLRLPAARPRWNGCAQRDARRDAARRAHPQGPRGVRAAWRGSACDSPDHGWRGSGFVSPRCRPLGGRGGGADPHDRLRRREGQLRSTSATGAAGRAS